MPRLIAGSPGPQAEPQRGAHVVAGARPDEGARRAGPSARRPPPSPRRRGSPRPEHVRQQRSGRARPARAPRRRSPRRGSTTSRCPRRRRGPWRRGPQRRSVSQSCGSRIARVAARHLRLGAPQPGPARDGERGHGHARRRARPRRRRRARRAARRRPAPSACRSTAPPGAAGAPSASITTSPCCWPATEIARDLARAAGLAPARRAAPPTRPRGRSRALRRCPSTSCGARPAATTAPSWRVDDQHLRRLGGAVHARRPIDQLPGTRASLLTAATNCKESRWPTRPRQT